MTTQIKRKLVALGLSPWMVEINSDGLLYVNYEFLEDNHSPALEAFVNSRQTENTDKALFIS